MVMLQRVLTQRLVSHIGVCRVGVYYLRLV